MNKNLYKQNMMCGCMNPNNNFCRVPSFMPSDPMLANSYVPYQMIEDIYTPETALNEGTIFPELVSPYSSGESYMTLMELYSEGGI